MIHFIYCKFKIIRNLSTYLPYIDVNNLSVCIFRQRKIKIQYNKILKYGTLLLLNRVKRKLILYIYFSRFKYLLNAFSGIILIQCKKTI